MEKENNFEASTSEPTSFEEWIELTAASTGTEREEVLEQMVSAYWTLKEIVGLVGRTDESRDDAVSDALLGSSELPTVDVPVGKLPEQDLELLRTELNTLEERLDELEDAVRDERSGDGSPDQLRETIEEVSTFAQELSAQQKSIHTYVIDEFDHLRLILEHLLETTDDLDRHADRTDESIEDLVRRAEQTDGLVAEHQRHLANHEALVDLKQRASTIGVTTADCENCGTTLQLSLLATPRCPQCNRKFAGLERRRGRLPFGSNKLTVTDEPASKRRPTLTWNELKIDVDRAELTNRRTSNR